MKIPLDMLERLESIAKERGISRHQAIREAIAEWVERKDKDEANPHQDSDHP